MKYQVQLFHIDRDAKPTDSAQLAGSFDVAADTHDAARGAVLARLASEERTVRSPSFVAGGGLSVVVTEPPSAPTAAQIRRARGGR